MRAIHALAALVLLGGCACSPDQLDDQLAVSGSPPSSVDAEGGPEVLALAEQVPATTTTTLPPTTTTTTTTTAPPPTTQPVLAAAAPTTTEPSQAPPTTVAASTGAHSGSLHPAIAAHFGTGELGHQAQRVAACESELDAGAVSPTNDHGLFQINRPTWDKPEAWDGWQQVTGTSWSAVYDADTNARFARQLYDRSGWGPWTCRHAA